MREIKIRKENCREAGRRERDREMKREKGR